MSYASNLQFIERSGLGVRVIDENVGTGDSSETDFDLDNDRIVSGGYVLSSGSGNTFTTLTETTDYTLDKESGKVVLTGTGVAALGTDILYATYWYSETFNDDVITDMIDSADAEIDKITGRRWTTATSVVEYKDGTRSSSYPTTDEPFMSDYDPDDYMILTYNPISKINACYFLNSPHAISKFYNYDAGTAAYTDKTDNVNSSTEAPFTLFDDAPATNDYIYIGSSHVFLGLNTNLSTVGTGSPAIDWEYYNGSSWTDITETDTDSGASTFTASGEFTWSYPYGWSTTSVNSYTAYWIRGKLTSGYTIDPICATMSLKDSVSVTLEPRQLIWDDYGRLSLSGASIPNGTRNIRIDYSYGLTTTPSYIVDLSVMLAAVRAYVNLSGGSYDDATMYTLGSKSVSIGEVYVNIERVLLEFKKRIDDILNMVGRRANISAI